VTGSTSTLVKEKNKRASIHDAVPGEKVSPSQSFKRSSTTSQLQIPDASKVPQNLRQQLSETDPLQNPTNGPSNLRLGSTSKLPAPQNTGRSISKSSNISQTSSKDSTPKLSRQNSNTSIKSKGSKVSHDSTQDVAKEKFKRERRKFGSMGANVLKKDLEAPDESPNRRLFRRKSSVSQLKVVPKKKGETVRRQTFTHGDIEVDAEKSVSNAEGLMKELMSKNESDSESSSSSESKDDDPSPARRNSRRLSNQSTLRRNSNRSVQGDLDPNADEVDENSDDEGKGASKFDSKFDKFLCLSTELMETELESTRTHTLDRNAMYQMRVQTRTPSHTAHQINPIDGIFVGHAAEYGYSRAMLRRHAGRLLDPIFHETKVDYRIFGLGSDDEVVEPEQECRRLSGTIARFSTHHRTSVQKNENFNLTDLQSWYDKNLHDTEPTQKPITGERRDSEENDKIWFTIALNLFYDVLVPHIELFHFEEGDCLLNEGDPLEGLLFLEAGRINILLADQNGRKKNRGSIEKDQMYGDLAALLVHPTVTGTLVAAKDSDVFFLPLDVLWEQIEKFDASERARIAFNITSPEQQKFVKNKSFHKDQSSDSYDDDSSSLQSSSSDSDSRTSSSSSDESRMHSKVDSEADQEVGQPIPNALARRNRLSVMISERTLVLAHGAPNTEDGQLNTFLTIAAQSRMMFGSEFWASCSSECIRVIMDVMEPKEFIKGKRVFSEGDKGETLGILVQGILKVHFVVAGGKRICRELKPGDVFGEVTALGVAEARTATIFAGTHAIFMELHRDDMWPVLQQFPIEHHEFEEKAKKRLEQNPSGNLNLVPYFQNWPLEVLQLLQAKIKLFLISPKHVINEKTGLDKNEMIVVRQGQATIYIKGVYVRTLEAGHHFRECCMFGLYPVSLGDIEIRSKTFCSFSKISAEDFAEARKILSYKTSALSKKFYQHLEAIQDDTMIDYMNPIPTLLRSLSFFNGCEMDFINAIASCLETQIYLKDQKVVVEGESGESMIILRHGTCTVEFRNVIVRTIERGDVYGETSVLGITNKRSSTMIANTLVIAYILHRTLLLHITERYPAAKKYFEEVAVKKMEQQVSSQSLYTLPLFSNSEPRFVYLVDLYLERRMFFSEEVIVEQGSVGEEMYILFEGEAEVLVNDKMVALLQGGTCFGELSVLGVSLRRTATIRAKCLSDVHILHRPMLEKCFAEFPHERGRFYQIATDRVRGLLETEKNIKQDDSDSLLHRLPFFKNSSNEFISIILQGHWKLYRTDEIVYKEGDIPDFKQWGILIILKGTLTSKRLYKQNIDFGEGAILGMPFCCNMLQCQEETLEATCVSLVLLVSQDIIQKAWDIYPHEKQRWYEFGAAWVENTIIPHGIISTHFPRLSHPISEQDILFENKWKRKVFLPGTKIPLNSHTNKRRNSRKSIGDIKMTETFSLIFLMQGSIAKSEDGIIFTGPCTIGADGSVGKALNNPELCDPINIIATTCCVGQVVTYDEFREATKATLMTVWTPHVAYDIRQRVLQRAGVDSIFDYCDILKDLEIPFQTYWNSREQMSHFQCSPAKKCLMDTGQQMLIGDNIEDQSIHIIEAVKQNKTIPYLYFLWWGQIKRTVYDEDGFEIISHVFDGSQQTDFLFDEICALGLRNIRPYTITTLSFTILQRFPINNSQQIYQLCPQLWYRLEKKASSTILRTCTYSKLSSLSLFTDIPSNKKNDIKNIYSNINALETISQDYKKKILRSSTVFGTNNTGGSSNILGTRADPSFLKTLEDGMQYKIFVSGESIVNAGDPCSIVYFICRGPAIAYGITGDELDIQSPPSSPAHMKNPIRSSQRISLLENHFLGRNTDITYFRASIYKQALQETEEICTRSEERDERISCVQSLHSTGKRYLTPGTFIGEFATLGLYEKYNYSVIVGDGLVETISIKREKLLDALRKYPWELERFEQAAVLRAGIKVLPQQGLLLSKIFTRLTIKLQKIIATVISIKLYTGPVIANINQIIHPCTFYVYKGQIEIFDIDDKNLLGYLKQYEFYNESHLCSNDKDIISSFILKPKPWCILEMLKRQDLLQLMDSNNKLKRQLMWLQELNTDIRELLEKIPLFVDIIKEYKKSNELAQFTHYSHEMRNLLTEINQSSPTRRKAQTSAPTSKWKGVKSKINTINFNKKKTEPRHTTVQSMEKLFGYQINPEESKEEPVQEEQSFATVVSVVSPLLAVKQSLKKKFKKGKLSANKNMETDSISLSPRPHDSSQLSLLQNHDCEKERALRLPSIIITENQSSEMKDTEITLSQESIKRYSMDSRINSEEDIDIKINNRDSSKEKNILLSEHEQEKEYEQNEEEKSTPQHKTSRLSMKRNSRMSRRKSRQSVVVPPTLKDWFEIFIKDFNDLLIFPNEELFVDDGRYFGILLKGKGEWEYTSGKNRHITDLSLLGNYFGNKKFSYKRAIARTNCRLLRQSRREFIAKVQKHCGNVKVLVPHCYFETQIQEDTKPNDDECVETEEVDVIKSKKSNENASRKTAKYGRIAKVYDRFGYQERAQKKRVAVCVKMEKLKETTATEALKEASSLMMSTKKDWIANQNTMIKKLLRNEQDNYDIII